MLLQLSEKHFPKTDKKIHHFGCNTEGIPVYLLMYPLRSTAVENHCINIICNTLNRNPTNNMIIKTVYYVTRQVCYFRYKPFPK